MCDAGDLKYGIVSGRAHVAGIFAERSLRLAALAGHPAFNHNFRRRRNFQVHRKALDDLHRLAANAARRGQFIHIGRNGLTDVSPITGSVPKMMAASVALPCASFLSMWRRMSR